MGLNHLSASIYPSRLASARLQGGLTSLRAYGARVWKDWYNVNGCRKRLKILYKNKSYSWFLFEPRCQFWADVRDGVFVERLATWGGIGIAIGQFPRIGSMPLLHHLYTYSKSSLSTSRSSIQGPISSGSFNATSNSFLPLPIIHERK